MRQLWPAEEELCKDTVSCERLTELLSMLEAKKENLLKLMLLKKLGDEIQMDELEADIKKTMNYDDHIIIPLESPGTRMTDRQQATVGERSSHRLNDVSTHSSRLMLTIKDVVSPAPQLQQIRNYDGTVAIEASKPKKTVYRQPASSIRVTLRGTKEKKKHATFKSNSSQN